MTKHSIALQAKPLSGAKRKRQPVEVKERILDSALNAFATSGYEGASVRSIANEAQVSISLLIHHFKSKDVLWKTVMTDIFARWIIMMDLDKAALATATASERLRAHIRRVVNFFAEFPALHRLMTLEGHEPSDRLTWLCETYLKNDYKTMCRLILDAQREGKVVDADPARLRLAITALAAVPFSVSAEYQYLTKKTPFKQREIEASIDLINRLLFKA